MKKAVIAMMLLSMTVLTLLVGCADRGIDKPETNLEFWIAENVDAVDFSSYQEKYGMMGGYQYYGSGYVPTVGESGEQTDPEACVIYTVTAYPDYSSGHRHMTGISITDPSVYVYGLTVKSSDAEVQAAMEENGFTRKSGENMAGRIYRKGKFSLTFTEGCIIIRVDVSNVRGIQF